MGLATACGGGGGGNSGPSPALPALESISLSPANASGTVNVTQKFTAVGTYSDQSTANLSTSVTWSSFNVQVATISNDTGFQGLATPKASGITRIKATADGFTGTALLTVGPVADNVLPITINGELCWASDTYPNKPCVSVTVCTPGTEVCQTIKDILLDTGSYGLRIFKDALTDVTLQQVAVSAGALAECVQFGDGTALWGPVQTADVILGNEPAIRSIPIQVIDATFGVRPDPDPCSDAYLSPADAQYTGILGVGLFKEDCGTACSSPPPPNHVWPYYACNETGCSVTAVPLASQVPNPAAALPEDNNGVIVQFPSLPAGGTTSVNGLLVLGIGTRSNNTPSGVTAYSADQFARFSTVFGGQTYSSYIDSGSNGLFFSPPASSPIPTCGGLDWFCPSSKLNLIATNTGDGGSPSGEVAFQIDNFTDLMIGSSNKVFSEIGANFLARRSSFDWGLPFFFGRDVFVGFDERSSSLGDGPYWAY